MTTLMQSGPICLVAMVFVSVVAADEQVSESDRAGSAATLSVPPLDHVQYPEDRPDWLNETPDLQSTTHTWVVVTRPWDSYEECAEELAILQRAAVDSYIRELTQVEDVDFYPINDKWIKSQLIAKEYQGSVTQGDVPMFEQAVKLEFTPRTQQEIRAAAKNLDVRQRLGALGMLVFSGLVVLIGSSSMLGILGRRSERRSAQMPTN